MVSDFMWGTANAQPATLSFWASSSVTGTFSGAIQNAAETRSYPFSFTISTTGAFAKFVIPIPGDTSGAWVMSGNANSMYVMFDIGNGANFRGPANAWASANYWGVTGSIRATTTNGVALNITGVKLEIGSVVTPYNRQSLAKSMADCQRYYSQTNGNALISATAAGQFLATSVVFPVTMRAIPTVTTGTIAGDVNLTSFNIDNITAIGCRAYSGAAAAGTAQFVRYFNANAEL
jgi:hypothetical protein